MRLTGKTTTLVPFGDEHLNSPDYLSWLRDYEVVKTINRREYLRPVSFAEVKEYCDQVCSSPTDIFLAIHFTEGDKFIGTARSSQINHVTGTADIGILVGDRDYWGKGVATDSLSLLAEYLFDRIGMRKVTAGMLAPNLAMRRVFEKLGFHPEGVIRKQDLFEGQYVDHIYLGCFKDEFIPQHV